jgi:hypothetical protein
MTYAFGMLVRVILLVTCVTEAHMSHVAFVVRPDLQTVNRLESNQL